MQESDIYINTYMYVSWTLNNNFTYSHMWSSNISWVVCKASLNEKSSKDSSSDEEDIQELAEVEIQESVEDVQDSVKGGVQEVTKEEPRDVAATLN